jgi:hypothetical protein
VTVAALEPVNLWPGDAKEIHIPIERGGFDGEVELAFTADAPGLTVRAPPIPPDSARGEARVTVAPEAAFGPRRLTVRATAAGQQNEAALEVHVLPRGYEPVAGHGPDRRGTPYYPRLVRRAGGQDVVLILIRPEGDKDPPYYLMENKVWNGVFREFARQHPDAVRKSAWEKGGRAGREDVGSRQDDLPALRVTREEAQRCAAWLGGRLPTARQLDQAAGPGQRDGRPGPSRGPRVAVGRRGAGPRVVTDPDNDDVSPFGIRDLAGNGREWTRDVLKAGGEELALLRGRSYTAARPLHYADLDDQQKRPELRPTQYPDHASPYTGFRVVLETPAP